MTDVTESATTTADHVAPGEQTQAASATESSASTLLTADPAAQTDAPAEQTTEAKPEGAPETYEFKAPDGHHFDDAVIAQFSEVAKELNLPQDKAQLVLDKMAPALAERQAAAMETVSKEWAEASRADKEFGGDKFDESLATARQGLEKFATPELQKLLTDTSLGNHPEVLRLFTRIGKALGEDTVIPGDAKATPTSRLATLYDNTPKSA